MVEDPITHERNASDLGDLVWPAVARSDPALWQEGEEPKPPWNSEGSDEPRSTDEAREQTREGAAAEGVEGRGSVGGMAGDEGCSGRRTGLGI